mmetsp:Transcript_27657/g.83449  ORF Transcript_27657/g.83449 Transcript_27657/m.83449 type:complete len:205 (+) Transcript_27657:138-752(+)
MPARWTSGTGRSCGSWTPRRSSSTWAAPTARSRRRAGPSASTGSSCRAPRGRSLRSAGGWCSQPWTAVARRCLRTASLAVAKRTRCWGSLVARARGWPSGRPTSCSTCWRGTWAAWAGPCPCPRWSSGPLASWTSWPRATTSWARRWGCPCLRCGRLGPAGRSWRASRRRSATAPRSCTTSSALPRSSGRPRTLQQMLTLCDPI